jgi:hypothetical protein
MSDTGYDGPLIWKQPHAPHGMFELRAAPLKACPDGYDMLFNGQKLDWFTNYVAAINAVKAGLYDERLGFRGADAYLPFELEKWWAGPSPTD